MQEILIKKLHAYMGNNNPDVLLQLQSEGKVLAYLANKIRGVDPLLNELIAEGLPPISIEEMCMNILTEDLRPSRFNYLAAIVSEKFEPAYRQFRFAGILKYELINMVCACRHVFDSMGFHEDTMNSRLIRYAITGAVHDYLENKRWN